MAALSALLLSLNGAPARAQEGAVPAKPTGLVTAATHDSVTLTWDNPGDSSITHYQIFRRDRAVHDVGDFVTIEENTGSAANSYTDDTVEPNRRYVYRVKAVNSNGASQWSKYARANTFRAANLRAIEVTANMVTLAWDAPAGFGAKVYREEGGSGKRSIRANPQIIGTNWTDGGEETPTSLQPGTDYTYWVALYKWNSRTRTATVYPLSEPVEVTTDAAPVPVTTQFDAGRAPDWLSARQNVVDHMVDDIEDGVDLEWSAPSAVAASVTGYVVYRRDLGATDDDWEFIGETEDQDFTDFGIDYSQDYPVYEYAVAAMRGTQQSELSNVGVGQVNLNPSDKQVTHVAAMRPVQALGTGTITWLKLRADVVEYRIQRILPPDHPSLDEGGDEQVVDAEWILPHPTQGSHVGILEFRDHNLNNRDSGMWSYRVKAKLEQDLPEDLDEREWSLPGRVYVNYPSDPSDPPDPPDPPEWQNHAPWGVKAQQERAPVDWLDRPGDVSVSWNPPTDGDGDVVVEYIVFRRTVDDGGRSGSWVSVENVPASQHTITDSEPTNEVLVYGSSGAHYEYRVGAKRASHTSPNPRPGNRDSASWSVSAYVQVLSFWEPAEPTGLAARQISREVVEVFWFRPSAEVLDDDLELSGYKMQRRMRGVRWEDLSDIQLSADDEFYEDDDAAFFGSGEETLEYRVRPLYTAQSQMTNRRAHGPGQRG